MMPIARARPTMTLRLAAAMIVLGAGCSSSERRAEWGYRFEPESLAESPVQLVAQLQEGCEPDAPVLERWVVGADAMPSERRSDRGTLAIALRAAASDGACTVYAAGCAVLGADRTEVVLRETSLEALCPGDPICGQLSCAPTGDAGRPDAGPPRVPDARLDAGGDPGLDAGGDAGDPPLEIPTPGWVGTGRDGPLDVPDGTTLEIDLCTPVRSVAGDRVDIAGFGPPPGSAVILHQTTDAFARADIAADLDAASAPGDAGRWELARIVYSGSGYVLLTQSPVETYASDASGRRAQLCWVPERSDVHIGVGARLTASRWDGSSGGILAFVANGTVRVDGVIDMVGRGFRGGPPGDTAGGRRGEGALGEAGYGDPGFSNETLGGGGTSNHDGGGAGGGGGGRGGSGGWTWDDAGGLQGLPGVATRFFISERALLGGGGGSGGANDGTSGVGGAGGGLIVVFAARLEGAGELDASGRAGAEAQRDGAGGGGAGGVIWVDADRESFDGDFVARGGVGGNNPATPFTWGGHPDFGTGGGGAGGRIRLQGLGGGSTSVTGGAAGVMSAESRLSAGASAGENGVLE